MLTPYEESFLNDYHNQAVSILHMAYPQLTTSELSTAVREVIDKRLQNVPVRIDNSYKHVEVQTTLLELIDYIRSREVITTNQGVMFSKHGKVPNPIATMLDGFLSNRKAMKKKMFQYPKGTADFAKYNLLQLLLKIDANGYDIMPLSVGIH